MPPDGSAGTSLLLSDEPALIGGTGKGARRLIHSSESLVHDAAVSPTVGQPTTRSIANAQTHDDPWAPSSILYNSVAHRFEPILDQFVDNQEFCKIPLTLDLQLNPLKYCRDVDPEPLFLVHAAMALAGHHVRSSATEHHRGTALQLLRDSLGIPNNLAQVYYMLDTIVILFSLDETQSAWGNWGIHLAGAFALLEACGGIQVWTKSPRAVVQVGLMLERTACSHTLTLKLSSHRTTANKSGITFAYADARCLVEIVMCLARLSAEKRKSSLMQHVNFDDTVISQIEESLGFWQHVSPPAADQDESSMHQDMDSMHCSEAWRNGLLLYVYRVFRWEPGHSIPVRVMRLARATADQIFACREDNSLVAKQALLPLFFAGCELRDESTRRKILRLCSLWDEVTRYHMINSTVPLLKEVWADQEERGFHNVWWGQVVDRMHAAEESCGAVLQMRLCFG
ncbi:fungal-specific transcription factor domain-containing protein [Apiospora hydei]|uniref:Fungal-specific transcription factor domain-containing protein n=1 Tax=Apiospora hydei TaxID=1337664 RepID=A0ABR1VVY5_9PEZI